MVKLNLVMVLSLSLSISVSNSLYLFQKSKCCNFRFKADKGVFPLSPLLTIYLQAVEGSDRRSGR
jgi:hypothetical protein